MSIAVFGYGSLVSQHEAELALGRPAALLPALLKGWVRDWSVVIHNPNTPPHFVLPESGRIPPFAIALNITKSKAMKQAPLNGALFEVSRNELAWLDAREKHYQRVEVTDEIITKHPFEKVYTYVAKEEFLDTGVHEAILPSSYVNVVEQAFKDLGNESYALYEQSTLLPKRPIVETQYVRM